jgi:L-idonate 5-dehydrogenase
MKAVVIHAVHDLRIDDLPMAEPEAGEVRIRISAGGICGSDLHYYHHGGFGIVRVREPMALGHEIAGTIDKLGTGVAHLSVGMRVAVNPSRPCNACVYCHKGLRNHCLDMRFLGSAMRFPHVQGGFRECITVDSSQAIPVAASVSLGEAAMAEPLAVCLNAAKQAGSLQGRRVLVTGSGPIGVLSVIVARHAGALEIVATDITNEPLAIARKIGATRTINTASEPDALKAYEANKGHFDVLFEASGHQGALVGGLATLRPGATVVQIGIGGEMTLPMNMIVAKELVLKGSFRFDAEFQLAADLISSGAIDVNPLITATLPFTDVIRAFDLASDRKQAMKVQLSFD